MGAIHIDMATRTTYNEVVSMNRGFCPGSLCELMQPIEYELNIEGHHEPV